MKRIYIAGKSDTEGAAIMALKSVVATAGATPVQVDTGARSRSTEVEIFAERVVPAHLRGADAVPGSNDRCAGPVRFPIAEKGALSVRLPCRINGWDFADAVPAHWHPIAEG